MQPVKALLLFCLVASPSLFADNLEERAWSVTSPLNSSPFQLNPAAVPTDRTVIAGLQLNRSEAADYTFNPNNNPVVAKHKAEKKDHAVAGQFPLGGAAFGIGADEYSRNITARADNRNNDLFEEFWVRDYKMKFLVDMMPDLRAGFTFRYQTLEADLLGAFGLNAADRTHYKGTMSGYSLGLSYKVQNFNLGAFTAPPLRGKAMIEGEQKIITDPGLGGLELNFGTNDKFSVGFTILRWSYKRDDRDDETTSPIDQRSIFLRGLEIEQFYRKTSALGLGGEVAVTPIVALKGAYIQQDGVFLFDPSKVPGDNKDSETKLRSTELRLGATLRNKQFFAELLLSQTSRDGNLIKVNRSDVGIRELGGYKHKDTAHLIVIGAAF